MPASFRRVLIGVVLFAAACLDPSGDAGSSVWALESISGTALPAAAGPALIGEVLADTLHFDVQSAAWKPRPLARADRVVRRSGELFREEWYYTYSRDGGGTFAIRALCADGDLASCIDGSATAQISGDELRIVFSADEFLGTLRYRRVR
jgi:hypothetical protein